MECPKCQHKNPNAQKFCGECGHNLTLAYEPSPKDLYLDDKIQKIQRYLPKGLIEKILLQRDKIEGERKQVTVMFCDIEGFTSLVERLGPEKSYSGMDQIYEILIHKVHDYDGTVNEMTGDGIMALFGAPIALEDAPQRAIRSGMAIHREMARFSEKTKEEGHSMSSVRMRIGIHTGPVVVGTLGNDLRVEFKAVGDTVNIASRMEGLAEPGTTYVTEDTFRFTEGLFRFEALGKRKVKGIGEKVHVYKVLSTKENTYRPRLGFERMIYSEMVGRDKELDRLELQMMKVINGEVSIVNIIGEAGIGKSRLVAELKKREVMKRVSLFEGRAISIGRNLSFHPIIDILKQWARIRENDSEVAAISKLETAVRRVFPEAVHELLPFVATLMGMKLSGRYAERIKGIEGEALEKLILKNLRDLLIKAAELSAVVIVTEDLHWADTSSIELMESLFCLAETKRILFINVFRPGHRETGDRIVKFIKENLSAHYIEILLQPLDARISETLINNMLNIKGLQHVFIEQIIERAGGNPFFIEEVVRSFIDVGAVISKDGTFEVTDKINTMVIPHTINEVLMARIDRLEEETRNLVRVASVIGRSFFHRILAEVARTVEDIDNRLSYLKKIQLIRERRRMEEIEYLFKHALAQEAAYESILERKREELHLKVAESIEKILKKRLHEFYGMLAYHCSKGNDLDKAEFYMLKAGEEALKSSASSEALQYCREALNLYLKKHGKHASSEKIANIEKNIALAFYNKGQYTNAVGYFDKVLRKKGAGSPSNKLVIITKLIIDLLVIIKELYLPSKKAKKAPNSHESEIVNLIYKRNEGLTYIDNRRFFIETVSLQRRMNKLDMTETVYGRWFWAFIGALFAYGGISFKLSEKSLEHARQIVNKKNIKELMAYKSYEAVINHCAGFWSRFGDYDAATVELALKNGQIWPVSTYIWFMAGVRIEQGKFSDVEMLIERLREISDVYNHDIARAYHSWLKIHFLIKTRKAYNALLEADVTVPWTAKKGMKATHMHFLGLRAIAQIMLDDVDGAQDSIWKASQIIDKQEGLMSATFLAPYTVGRFLADIYRLEQAIVSGDHTNLEKYRNMAHKSNKEALRNSTKYTLFRTKVFRLTGLYCWLIGEQSKAFKWWNKTIQEGERLGARVDLSRTYMEIGKRLLEHKSRYKKFKAIDAKDYLGKAKILFEEIGLQQDLNDLEKVMANA